MHDHPWPPTNTTLSGLRKEQPWGDRKRRTHDRLSLHLPFCQSVTTDTDVGTGAEQTWHRDAGTGAEQTWHTDAGTGAEQT